MQATPLSATVQGRELIEQSAHIDSCLADWLLKLDDFDTWGTWAEDGHGSCVAWLRDRCRMGRATAADKVRVAHELGRRKILAEAFAANDVSYSQIRCLTRIDNTDEAVDRMLLDQAKTATVFQLENFVRHYRASQGQDRPPGDLYDKRGLWRQPGFQDGMDRIIIELPAEEAERVMNILDTYLDWLYRHPNTADESSLKTPEASQPVDESSLKTPEPDAPEPAPRAGVRARRVDALLDLLEHAAYQHHDRIDIERAAIGITIDYDTLINAAPGAADLASGATITGEAARRLACDAGMHRLIIKGSSEILDVGRKTRIWSVAQRRAIAARHGHRCAIAGCERRIYQIHHIDWWENDGMTDIHNGLPLCLTHHHYVHEGGWTITYDPPTGITTLTGPAGQTIRSTARVAMAA